LNFAGKLPDPPHAVRGRFGMVAELLGHQGDAAADAEPADGLAGRVRDRIMGQDI